MTMIDQNYKICFICKLIYNLFHYNIQNNLQIINIIKLELEHMVKSTKVLVFFSFKDKEKIYVMCLINIGNV